LTRGPDIAGRGAVAAGRDPGGNPAADPPHGRIGLTATPWVTGQTPPDGINHPHRLLALRRPQRTRLMESPGQRAPIGRVEPGQCPSRGKTPLLSSPHAGLPDSSSPGSGGAGPWRSGKRFDQDGRMRESRDLPGAVRVEDDEIVLGEQREVATHCALVTLDATGEVANR
jgi:hypothetical protein